MLQLNVELADLMAPRLPGLFSTSTVPPTLNSIRRLLSLRLPRPPLPAFAVCGKAQVLVHGREVSPRQLRLLLNHIRVNPLCSLAQREGAPERIADLRGETHVLNAAVSLAKGSGHILPTFSIRLVANPPS